MCFFARDTPVPYVNLLSWLVASGNLGKLTHVPDTTTPCFLTVDPVKAGGLSFFNLLNLVLLVTATKRAVSPEF
jgi:hypothetical protein